MDDAKIEKLLEGLEGDARAERAELIEWLVEQGITADEIRSAPVPMLVASRRLIGDNGDFVSTREMSEEAGIDLEFLQRVQRAIGLVRVDDPDAAVHLRADVAAAAHAKEFLDLGIHPDQVVQVVRILAEGLSHAAEVMRGTALSTILQPGAREVRWAHLLSGAVSEPTAFTPRESESPNTNLLQRVEELEKLVRSLEERLRALEASGTAGEE